MITRRHFIVTSAAAAPALLAIPSVSMLSLPAHAATGNVVMLVWQGYDDATALKPLTDAGLVVEAQYISSNSETITKLRGGALGSIDVVSPGLSTIEPLVAAGLIQPMDPARLVSNGQLMAPFANVTWNKIDGKLYSIPVAWSDYPMVYRSDLFADPPAKWTDLADPKYKGRLVTLDDESNLRILARALFGTADFATITKAQLAQTVEAFLPIKANLVTISPSYGDIVDVLARGDAQACVLGWRFVEVQLKAKGFAATSYVPEEGTYLWCDNYSIATDAPNLDAAYAVIDRLTSPEGNAIIGAATGSGVVNAGAVALLPEDQRALHPYDDIDNFLAKNPFFLPAPLDESGDIATRRDWSDAWEQVKLG
ncbi:MAG: hypothetical protein CFE34_00955 [Rhodobacteraceae bacterium PARR1]|nr:MAG: hypothetical protein CFE34_00955 [Rhodobacteraceae bacterium PARR1]